MPLCIILGGKGDLRSVPFPILGLRVFGAVGVHPTLLALSVDDLGVLPIVLAQQGFVLHAPIIPYLGGGASKKTRFIGIS